MEPSRAGTPQEPPVWKKKKKMHPIKQKCKKRETEKKKNPDTDGGSEWTRMDMFNVEVIVTLKLNMLDEVTNTVQLIKSDYS